jgi:Chitobiase/beta-hexosaminidase C-terminal domain
VKKLILFLFLLGTANAAVTVTATATNPYGNIVMPGVTRQPGWAITGGTNNTLNFTLGGTSSGVTLSCASACAPEVAVTMPSTASACSVTGSVGSYSVTGGTVFTVTGTSTDDNTKSATITFQVCDTTSGAFVDVEPSYNQAFQGQSKTLQSYVGGYANENVTWAITTTPSGGNATLADTSNRDTVFNSGTVAGRYVITATSVANGSISGTAIIYVSPNTLPRTTSPNLTESTECYVDPALTGSDIEIGSGQTYTTISAAPTQSMSAGTIVRIHPGTYHEAMQVGGTGTPSQPIYICGVADGSGNLPIMDGSNSTESSSNGSGLVGLGGIKLFNCLLTNTGYGLGSCGPDYVSITGIRLQKWNVGETYYPLGNMGSPTVWTTGGPPAGIWSRSGQHLHIEGVDEYDVAWGALLNNNTFPNSNTNDTAGQMWADYQQFIGSHISDFSFPNGFSTHGLYMQGGHVLIEGNLIENPQIDCSPLPLNDCNYDGGNFIKARGSASIIRYNTLRGLLTGNAIAYPDMADSATYTSLSQYLGLQGDTTCGDSAYCTITTNRATIPQMLENQQALQEDYSYGNVFSMSAGIKNNSVYDVGSYAAFNSGHSGGSGSECEHTNSAGTALCNPEMDHNGIHYSFNNTIDQAGAGGLPGGIWQTANDSSGTIVATAQYFATAIWSQNDIIWNDANHNTGSNPFQLNLDSTHVATYTTDLFQSGLVTCTGTITGGTTQGWGGYTNNFAFSPSNPIKTVTGLGGSNCLTTSTMPYNRATYAPQTTSAAVGAGSAITNAVIAHMPDRFQPDPVNGFMVARVHPTTIGALDASATQPTISSIAVTPSSYSMSTGGATLWYGATTTFSNGLTENCSFRCIWGPASGTILFNFYPERNEFGTNNVIGTENATANEDSTTGSSPLTIGSVTVANPTFSPPAGTYTGTQTVTISTSTGGASICYRINATPAATTPGTCDSGSTLYTGPISVAVSETVNALGTLSSATNSSVVGAAYTISPALNGSAFGGTQTFGGTGTIH